MSENRQKPPRAVAPRYPFINLQRALERSEEFRKAALDHAILSADARRAWGYGEKSSGGDQTIAALRYYGLLEREGSGRVRLTELARRYLMDERPEVRADLRKQFALQPSAMRALWDLWRNEPPPDVAARSILKADLGYPDKAAEEALRIYRDNLVLVGALPSDILPPVSALPDDELADVDEGEASPATTVRVGDYVQWVSGGVEQFKAPRKVVWLSDDGGHLRVQGSMTGIPTADVTVAAPPSVRPETERRDHSGSSSAWAKGKNDLNVLQRGSRLEINADVDLEGLQNLKEVLSHYESILKLLAPKPSGGDDSR